MIRFGDVLIFSCTALFNIHVIDGAAAMTFEIDASELFSVERAKKYASETAEECLCVPFHQCPWEETKNSK